MFTYGESLQQQTITLISTVKKTERLKKAIQDVMAVREIIVTILTITRKTTRSLEHQSPEYNLIY